VSRDVTVGLAHKLNFQCGHSQATAGRALDQSGREGGDCAPGPFCRESMEGVCAEEEV
jgi:hypothetical protein